MTAVVTTNRATTKAFVVNSAFLQEIKDSHPELWETLHRVRQVCECEDTPFQSVSQLVRLLNELRDQMAFQFALEEAYGYIEVGLDFAATEANQARKVIAQHCSLYLQLSELIEKAEELQYRGAAAAHVHELVAETQAFDERLRAHERSEDELIEASFDRR